MDQQFWIFIVIGVGVFFIVLFSVASHKFRKRFDPYKKIRREIARQTGLTMVPMRGDPFALQGSIGDRFVSVFTRPVWLWRRRIDKYEIQVANPEQLNLSFQSRHIPSSFANPPTTNLDPSVRPFFEQFEVYGKSVTLAFELAENETLWEKLLKLSQCTKAVKLTVRNDRIVCYESEFRMMSSNVDEVSIACLIFDILSEMAKLVDNYPKQR
ncbi:MAG: hypothetical protein CL608_16910 [Anaerolineaceae bacterium]|nr:hypothetical protein [Anaerolineaceae bacterium]